MIGAPTKRCPWLGAGCTTSFLSAATSVRTSDVAARRETRQKYSNELALFRKTGPAQGEAEKPSQRRRRHTSPVSR